MKEKSIFETLNAYQKLREKKDEQKNSDAPVTNKMLLETDEYVIEAETLKGQFHGNAIIQHKSNGKLTKLQYHEGALLMMESFENDKILVSAEFDSENNLKLFKQFENGLVKSIQRFVNGILHGESVFYSTAGDENSATIKKFNNGVLE